MASSLSHALTETLHGRQLMLDVTLPALEGQRVRVSIEPLDDPGPVLSAEAQQALWQEWRERGPQGPIETGSRLRALRQRVIESGVPLLDWDGIADEVAARRGGWRDSAGANRDGAPMDDEAPSGEA